MEIIAGGYFVVGRGSRPSYRDSSRLPELLWTPTSCICDLYPEEWAFSWNWERSAEAAAFAELEKYGIDLNLPVAMDRIKRGRDADRGKAAIADSALKRLGLCAADLPEIQRWADQRHAEDRISCPSLFEDIEAAREFISRFVRNKYGLKILGIGLARGDADELIKDINEGCRSGKNYSVHRVLSRGEPLANGLPVGYEPLGHEGTDFFHSFICNGLEVACCEQLKLELNEHGRFADYESCETAVDYICLDSTGAEPVFWQSWCITEYDLAVA